MREAIGGTWLFTIVIVFIVLFSSYLAISVNYSKAFKVKNGIVDLIEQNEGLSSETQTQISNYLDKTGYFVYGECNSKAGEKGYESNGAGNNYKYCIVKTNAANEELVAGSTVERAYYKVKVFFRLDLPVLGDIFTFPVTGQTKAIYYAKD